MHGDKQVNSTPSTPSRAAALGVRWHMLRRQERQRWLFVAFLALFYPAWLVIVATNHAWGLTLQNWPMAVAMGLGSYVAGSTPMGGGAIGFPVLVLLFDQPAAMGRNFAFAIQSIGMTAASCYILAGSVPLAWRPLRWSMLGTLLGTPIGVTLLAPALNDLTLKLVFATLWAGLGVMIALNLQRWSKPEKAPIKTTARSRDESTHRTLERTVMLGVGLIGGATVASFTGTGVNLLLFATLVLLYRVDLRIAVPTSVVLMAFTSVIGLGACWSAGELTKQPGVFGAWLAAAPVAALGAPLGAYAVRHIPRSITLSFVALLCFGQFGWTLIQNRPSSTVMVSTILGLLALTLLFWALGTAGRKRADARNQAAV